MYVGGNRSPGGNLHCQRESPTLSHEEWVWPRIEPTTSEVTGADVNFEHRSYHCATLTVVSQPWMHGGVNCWLDFWILEPFMLSKGKHHTHMSSLNLDTHSSCFKYSLAFCTEKKSVATRNVGWKVLYLCFWTSSGSLNGPCSFCGNGGNVLGRGRP
jgi:hypothetical protein